MSASTGFRRALLGAALLLTLGAVWWVEAGDDGATDARADDRPRRPPHPPPPKPDVRRAVARSDVQVQPLPAARDTSLDPSRIRRAARPVTADAFAARSWAPPPKPTARLAPVVEPPPPPPEAPPLPFTYLGMLADGERTTLFLARGNEDVVVREGEVVDAVWRLDHVDASQARFTYLPLQKSRSLTLGTR